MRRTSYKVHLRRRLGDDLNSICMMFRAATTIAIHQIIASVSTSSNNVSIWRQRVSMPYSSSKACLSTAG